MSTAVAQKSGSDSLNLPELLRTESGERVKNKADWQNARRAEVVKLFEDNVYGQVPKELDSLRFYTKKVQKGVMNGTATLKEVDIQAYRGGDFVTIRLVLFIPDNTPIAPPVFLLINHRDTTNMDPTRKVKMEFWPAEEIIQRGYAVAAFHVADVAADNKNTYDQQVLRLYPDQKQAANGMRAIGAWGWGASRVMDYLVTDAAIDPQRVAVVGHSRGGKAALWCGAQDERFALTISNDSGCTGAALSRRMVGETVKVINTNFPHWFSQVYKTFNDREKELPVDQHMLIALMAPRAVYVASASEDAWADPVGEFLSVKYAEPVFKLFGLSPLPTATQPTIGKAVVSQTLGYHLRPGGHGLTLFDWERYMDFADVYFKKTR
ncbi:acetylxylan esterase [Arundinibacter roseus]|uniref:Acetylxylan esterase n=2 Tax=Arundinibacter roseus TaxID=2070510 RepID=A0A4R4KKQ5_9BACT|nr:acetylxylan esterase [Arundinibacter roseus]